MVISEECLDYTSSSLLPRRQLVSQKLRPFYTGSKLILTLACLIVISLAQPVRTALAEPDAAIIRVATTGFDASGCGADTNPCRTIQYAVNRAKASGSTITVAEGVYSYNSAADLCSWAITPAVVCIVDKNITILGGYTTSNWYISDPTIYKTIIDGQNSCAGSW